MCLSCYDVKTMQDSYYSVCFLQSEYAGNQFDSVSGSMLNSDKYVAIPDLICWCLHSLLLPVSIAFLLLCWDHYQALMFYMIISICLWTLENFSKRSERDCFVLCLKRERKTNLHKEGIFFPVYTSHLLVILYECEVAVNGNSLAVVLESLV